ncbi:venom metalloproteinase BumaMPs1-like [Dermacentor andersoni]|uniref:venom metalloproteinase BumaMPs1-like n=1 Tax=Dermacentor andersoni TaxID=34620 RepID=UPI002155541E|nr:venom metalloproteinase BumaMPs1-like [Dermacentor andersoni]
MNMLEIFVLSILCGFTLSLTTAEYGIVYPTLLSSRDSDEKKVLRINERMTLNLERSHVFSDQFMFISEENGERIHLPMRKDDYEKDLYHDQHLMASLMVRTDDGVHVEGIINDTLRIKPLLQMARSEEGHIAHKLFQMPPTIDNPPTHRDYKPANVTEPAGRSSAYAEARSRGKTYYPEIHIVQDSAHAQVFGFKKTDVIMYFGVFFNAVNLRYATNRRPRIQLRISGITMSKNAEKYLVHPRQDQYEILDEETLAEFKRYYETKTEYTYSDLVFLITGRDMVFYENGVIQTWVGGYSYVGGFCQNSKVGMSEDPPGSYYGVQVFSHEVGHSLGCVHDGSPALPELPGHKGSSACSSGDGYMMSYVMADSKMYTFSKCCIADITNLLSRSEWSCLSKRQRKPIKREGLPGRRISGNEYCRRCYPGRAGMHYNKAYGVRDCKLQCEDNQDSYILGAPEGVPCDVERKGRKHCVLGECIENRGE